MLHTSTVPWKHLPSYEPALLLKNAETRGDDPRTPLLRGNRFMFNLPLMKDL